MSTLYLIRHATPGVPNYDNLPPGPGLGTLGQQQANWIADLLQGRGIHQLWASDFTRTLETLTPLQARLPHLPVRTTPALREREPRLESHDSLVQRVREWLLPRLPEFQAQPTAIFSHCGPLNMVLECLDPGNTRLAYPYRNEFGCLTPCAGIWEIQWLDEGLQGQLHLFPVS